MARNIANNPSGKYLRMTDEEVARERARFERAVERQRAKDMEAAHPYAHKSESREGCPACERRARKVAQS